MTTKQLDRLMFAQGGMCFFCKRQLPKAEASVEHLFAKAKGGDNNDENCVACCKAINALFGSMSLKEKFQVVLNQQGQFKCLNGVGASKSSSVESAEKYLELVLANLKQRGQSKPSTIKTLTRTITSIGLSASETEAVIQLLQAGGHITINENKVTYAT